MLIADRLSRAYLRDTLPSEELFSVYYVLCTFQLCHKFPPLIIANRQPYTNASAQSETEIFV